MKHQRTSHPLPLPKTKMPTHVVAARQRMGELLRELDELAPQAWVYLQTDISCFNSEGDYVRWRSKTALPKEPEDWRG